MPTATMAVRLSFVDRDANEGTLTIYVPSSLSTSDVIAFLNAYYSTFQDLSSASLVSARIYKRTVFDSPNQSQIGSDCTSFAVFYYRNGDIYEALYVPSPKGEIFESNGEYQGIRLDALATAVLSFNAALLDFPQGLATQDGEPFPQEYVVGGLVL